MMPCDVYHDLTGGTGKLARRSTDHVYFVYLLRSLSFIFLFLPPLIVHIYENIYFTSFPRIALSRQITMTRNKQVKLS